MEPNRKSDYVSKEGRVDIDARDKPTTGGLPALTVKNLSQGNFIKVTCNFYALIEVRMPVNNNGFYYEIKAKPDGDTKVQAVTPAKSLVYNFTPIFSHEHALSSMMNCSFTVIFEVTETTPPSDIDFEVEFSAPKYDGVAARVQGRGAVNNFTLMGSVNS